LGYSILVYNIVFETKLEQNKPIFLAISIIPVLMLTVIPSVYASYINCSEEPDHELCNGERGRSGMTSCDVAGILEDGWL
jgi:hypothetical protein